MFLHTNHRITWTKNFGKNRIRLISYYKSNKTNIRVVHFNLWPFLVCQYHQVFFFLKNVCCYLKYVYFLSIKFVHNNPCSFITIVQLIKWINGTYFRESFFLFKPYVKIYVQKIDIKLQYQVFTMHHTWFIYFLKFFYDIIIGEIKQYKIDQSASLVIKFRGNILDMENQNFPSQSCDVSKWRVKLYIVLM